MTQEKQHDIALMRYSLISPIINGLPEEYSSLDAFYRDAAKKGTVSPDGNVKHFSAATIERWYRNYKNGGFDALIPQGRVDEGKPRKLDADLQEQINYLKQNYPRMSASAIFKQLHDNGSIVTGEVSESTVCRYINQLALELKTTTNRDMRRYERPHINEVWCGDSSVGPYLKTADGQKHKVYIIALIDDASRFIVGIDVFFNDNFINLMSVIKSAVAKYGRPQMFNFDNGKAYRNKQMELLAGLPKLNSTLRLAIHEPLYQRLVMNYNLEGLSKEEGRSYIHEKLKGAGCNQTVFHEAAVEAILNAADGTPVSLISCVMPACLSATAVNPKSLPVTSPCRQSTTASLADPKIPHSFNVRGGF